MTKAMILAAALFAASAVAAQAQDAAKGAIVFHKCMPCHRIGPGAKTLVGPELNGLDGRHTGSVPGYNYSDANKKSGIVWNEANFKKYVRNPRAMIPGTKMIFAGIDNQHQIDNLWAYVSQFDAEGNIKKK